MHQDFDLADGQPMFIMIGGREIVVMDAVAFRAMQDAALSARPADSDMVERVVDAVIDAANIVSHDGYYEIDRDAATRAAIAAMGSDMDNG